MKSTAAILVLSLTISSASAVFQPSIFARQDNTAIDYPAQCASSCFTTNELLTTCNAPSCLCKNSVISEVGGCLSCVTTVNGASPDQIREAQNIIDQTVSSCRAAGYQVSSVTIQTSSVPAATESFTTSRTSTIAITTGSSSATTTPISLPSITLTSPISSAPISSLISSLTISSILTQTSVPSVTLSTIAIPTASTSRLTIATSSTSPTPTPTPSSAHPSYSLGKTLAVTVFVGFCGVLLLL